MAMVKMKAYCLVWVLTFSVDKCTGSNVDYSVYYDYDYAGVTLRTTAGPSTTSTISTSSASTTTPTRQRPGDPDSPDVPARGSDLPEEDHPRNLICADFEDLEDR